MSYFLHYKGDPSYLQYPEFCCVKLLLHYLWREYKEVATYTNEFRAPNYVASYQACVTSHQHLPNYFYNWTLEEACKAAADINEFDDDFVDNLELYQSFEALHARVQNTDGVEIEDPDRLSDRELDCNYDWSIH